MHEFVYASQAARVVFGRGALGKLEPEAALLGAARALVLSTPGQRALAERAVGLLGARAADIHDGAVMHVPAETVLAALDDVRRAEADSVAEAAVRVEAVVASAAAASAAIVPRVATSAAVAAEAVVVVTTATNNLRERGRGPRLTPGTRPGMPGLFLGDQSGDGGGAGTVRSRSSESTVRRPTAPKTTAPPSRWPVCAASWTSGSTTCAVPGNTRAT